MPWTEREESPNLTKCLRFVLKLEPWKERFWKWLWSAPAALTEWTSYIPEKEVHSQNVETILHLAQDSVNFLAMAFSVGCALKNHLFAMVLIFLFYAVRDTQ